MATHVRESDEYQYVDLVNKILPMGKFKLDKTGTGTISLLGALMRFDITLVVRRGALEELLRFTKSSTSSNSLDEKSARIWEATGSKCLN